MKISRLNADNLFPADGMIGQAIPGSEAKPRARAIPIDQIASRAMAIKSAVDALLEDAGERAGVAFTILSDELSNLYQPCDTPRTPGPVKALRALNNPANDNTTNIVTL